MVPPPDPGDDSPDATIRWPPRSPDGAAQAPDAAHALRLVVIVEGEPRGFAVPERGEITVGRGAGVDVSVDHPAMSRRQLALSRGEDGLLRVRDLGSRNGTIVGGRALGEDQEALLHLDEMIEAGPALLVVQQAAPAASAVKSLRRANPLLETLPSAAAPSGGGAMARLLRIAERVAKGAISVLLLGETGAGKEVMARRLHEMSPRAGRPFVALNCAAFSETLLESELFGHERGAFTGAAQQKPGLVETADGGTLFLDEVGELPLATQVKLLRVLEQREVLRVGGLKPRTVDVRVIAATNRDPETEIAAGRFRQDLYFRLNGVTLVVPPLRQRADEIEPLARGFAEGAAKAQGLAAPGFSAAALEALRRWPWPGNVRELRNVVDRAVLLAGDERIEPEHLLFDTPSRSAPTSPSTSTSTSSSSSTPSSSSPPSSANMRSELADLERQRILEALERCAGNQTRAAEMLGISRRTLLHRLDEYGVARPRKK